MLPLCRIGIENRYNRYGNPNVYKNLVKNNAASNTLLNKKLIELSFGISKTKPFRKEAFEAVTKLIPKNQISQTKKPHLQWIQHISKFVKFIISPHGHGLDTHRTWEGLYSGAFIIVKTSTLDALYSDLPVIILKHWHDLDVEELNAKYIKFNRQLPKFDYSKLFFPFWVDKLVRVGLKFN